MIQAAKSITLVTYLHGLVVPPSSVTDPHLSFEDHSVTASSSDRAASDASVTVGNQVNKVATEVREVADAAKTTVESDISSSDRTGNPLEDSKTITSSLGSDNEILNEHGDIFAVDSLVVRTSRLENRIQIVVTKDYQKISDLYCRRVNIYTHGCAALSGFWNNSNIIDIWKTMYEQAYALGYGDDIDDDTAGIQTRAPGNALPDEHTASWNSNFIHRGRRSVRDSGDHITDLKDKAGNEVLWSMGYFGWHHKRSYSSGTILTGWTPQDADLESKLVQGVLVSVSTITVTPFTRSPIPNHLDSDLSGGIVNRATGDFFDFRPSLAAPSPDFPLNHQSVSFQSVSLNLPSEEAQYQREEDLRYLNIPQAYVDYKMKYMQGSPDEVQRRAILKEREREYVKPSRFVREGIVASLVQICREKEENPDDPDEADSDGGCLPPLLGDENPLYEWQDLMLTGLHADHSDLTYGEILAINYNSKFVDSNSLHLDFSATEFYTGGVYENALGERASWITEKNMEFRESAKAQADRDTQAIIDSVVGDKKEIFLGYGLRDFMSDFIREYAYMQTDLLLEEEAKNGSIEAINYRDSKAKWNTAESKFLSYKDEFQGLQDSLDAKEKEISEQRQLILKQENAVSEAMLGSKKERLKQIQEEYARTAEPMNNFLASIETDYSDIADAASIFSEYMGVFLDTDEGYSKKLVDAEARRIQEAKEAEGDGGAAELARRKRVEDELRKQYDDDYTVYGYEADLAKPFRDFLQEMARDRAGVSLSSFVSDDILLSTGLTLTSDELKELYSSRKEALANVEQDEAQTQALQDSLDELKTAAVSLVTTSYRSQFQKDFLDSTGDNFAENTKELVEKAFEKAPAGEVSALDQEGFELELTTLERGKEISSAELKELYDERKAAWDEEKKKPEAERDIGVTVIVETETSTP